MRRGFRSQYFLRMRIESDYNGRSVGRLGVFGRGRDDCLVSEMDPIEYSDRDRIAAAYRWARYKGSRFAHERR